MQSFVKITAIIFFLFTSVCSLSFSQENDARAMDPSSTQADSLGERATKALDKASEAISETSKTLTGDLTTKDWRREGRFSVLGNYGTWDLFLPGKMGMTGTYIQSEDLSWDVEYLTANLAVPLWIRDMGRINEKRLSILRRAYWSNNSFSGYVGLSWNSLVVHLGDDVLAKLFPDQTPSFDVLRLETLGVNLGFGNRWTILHGFTYGVDWLGVSQPLLVTKKDFGELDNAANDEEKDQIKKAMGLAVYFPRVYLFKFQAGLTF